ncbi:MAG: MBL fold metallo-hydrolase [Chthoniobacteraceae bacterium]|jgi:Cft2 family RNA processing exonuclease
MELLNLTRHVEIGANCYALTIAGRTVILDCGMHPKHEGELALPNLPLLKARPPVDAIFISHAHHDHIGSLPILARSWPDAPVFTTEATAALSEVMLHNSVNVMTRQREENSALTEYPLFTHREVDVSVRKWRKAPLHRPFTIDGDRAAGGEDATFEFFDAGHVLGAAGILFRAEGRTVFYSGDVNFNDQTISRAARFPGEGVDILIIETTRGDHPTPPGFTRAGEEKRLAAAIEAAFERGGAVVMPLFALGKTQELLVMLNDFRRRAQIPSCPIYIGGLGAKLTEIYDSLAHSAPRLRPEMQILDFTAPFVLAGRGAHETPIRPRRIYALSSGMMTEKTLSHTFGQRILASPEHSLFFVGYADPASPAGRIRSAAPGAALSLSEGAPPIPIRCAVEQFNFSGHASRESIRDYILRLKPKKVLLVHGDPPAVAWFQHTLKTDLPACEVLAPPPGVVVEI